MYGLSSSSKEAIFKIIDDLFDKIALRFIGNIPKISHKKTMLIGFEQNTNLANLFVQAMNNKTLNHLEQDVVKGILGDAFSYVDILKNKTSSSIINRLEASAREAKMSNDKIPEEELEIIIKEELEKAKIGMETIVTSESTKARNLGTIIDISRAASLSENINDRDPVIGFAGINDNRTCEECIRLFLMPDGITPRLWRLSECSAGYFKRGNPFPSILGLHPRCRHIPFMVPSDWGFNSKGHIEYKNIGHNELEKQRSD